VVDAILEMKEMDQGRGVVTCCWLCWQWERKEHHDTLGSVLILFGGATALEGTPTSAQVLVYFFSSLFCLKQLVT
jgi:hypothetical protein